MIHNDRPAIVRLAVLGRVSLQAGGDDVQPVLVQPKRLALLVWLVLRRPGGFVRRDELIGMFWPDSTDDRARASLRQALAFLRRHLGPDIIAKRGDAELGIAPGTLTCDALDFLAAVARGEDAAAVSEYGGDLMPGFSLDASHDFEL
ncbi:MAG TPA: hypothetical protein VK912_14620, partial [Longimicrobiales bacterium]|nr:hypothetical protein [Longimicrobiales bacterium]